MYEGLHPVTQLNVLVRGAHRIVKLSIEAMRKGYLGEMCRLFGLSREVVVTRWYRVPKKASVTTLGNVVCVGHIRVWKLYAHVCQSRRCELPELANGLHDTVTICMCSE